MPRLRHLLITWSRTRVCTTLSAVKAHARRAGVVHHNRSVDVYVVNDGLIYVDDRSVVHETVVVPPPPREAFTVVPEAVIYTAVEPDLRSPIAVVEVVRTVLPTPVSRRPQQAALRGKHPGTGHPVIVSFLIIPAPVPWDPESPIFRARRLIIVGYIRGREADR